MKSNADDEKIAVHSTFKYTADVFNALKSRIY